MNPIFSHMRQLTSGVDKGKFVRLEKMLTAKKLDGSNNKRLLSEMPSSITLNRQPYRHVDNVCFQNREIMDRFLERWRTTGHQQAAWLFGSYSKFDDVPLGIRCNVDAIYPMPQQFKSSRLTLSDDENEKVRLGDVFVLFRKWKCGSESDLSITSYNKFLAIFIIVSTTSFDFIFQSVIFKWYTGASTGDYTRGMF